MSECLDHGKRGNRQGYASCWSNGKYIGRHVRALIAQSGEEPAGRVARHKCNNPRCVNPLHLEWGTQADNIRDAGASVLTDQQVEDIRRKYTGKRGEQTALAAEYGVARVTITQIVRRTRRVIRSLGSGN